VLNGKYLPRKSTPGRVSANNAMKSGFRTLLTTGATIASIKPTTCTGNALSMTWARYAADRRASLTPRVHHICVFVGANGWLFWKEFPNAPDPPRRANRDRVTRNHHQRRTPGRPGSRRHGRVRLMHTTRGGPQSRYCNSDEMMKWVGFEVFRPCLADKILCPREKSHSEVAGTRATNVSK
jgi:hypothetical protein